jgi:L-2,4-diaminobutyrate transaminase
VDDHQRLGPTIISSGRGSSVYDHTGKEHIDFGAGLWCVNVGYGRPELARVAQESTQELCYFHAFGNTGNAPMARLADKLLSILHDQTSIPNMARVFMGCSGSDANDTAFKLVRYYNNLLGRPNKKKIISRIGAYHGVSYASGSLTGIPAYHKSFDMQLPDVYHVSCPHYFRFSERNETEEEFSNRLVLELESLILREGPETIAAFIAEPVMGTGGVLIPPRGYFEGVSRLLKKHDILFIVDEVITGFGRTGKWFGSEHFGIQPDIMNLAKGLTSAYFPLSATIISERIWEVLKSRSAETGPFMHGFTYSGHPVGCAIALANIEIIEKEDLVKRTNETGLYFLKTAREALAGSRFVGDVRGIGLMGAVEYAAALTPMRFFAAGQGPHRLVARLAAEEGVLVRGLPFIEVNSFSPPLVITPKEIDVGLDRFVKALTAAEPEISRMAEA